MIQQGSKWYESLLVKEHRKDPIRYQYIFRGIIQGVGFRPTIYRCATALGLSGFVCNRRSDVLAEIQGNRETVEQFLKLFKKKLPKAALVEKIEIREVPSTNDSLFQIVESKATMYSFPPIPPDLAICPECAEELMDSSNRRYLYPFITCTQCGPRYSIVEDTPFDRKTTSMIDFPQCPECLKEYNDPENRRFHSQTNSCHACGPKLKLETTKRQELPGDPVIETIHALQEGKIIAIQGIGGFHLAADPSNSATMQRLRRDKERERKPFALMVCNSSEVERLCRVKKEDLELLFSPLSPIIIFPAGKDIPEYMIHVSNTHTLGVMLPYTPLHKLLFHHPGLLITYKHLIMTSGNLKGEPIVTQSEEAFRKLADITDLFLYHNRRIIFRTDDSILRTTHRGQKVLLRRSRGYVPRLISLKSPVEKITLGTGGDLKSAPALAKDTDVYLAPYLGDLEDPLTLRDFEHQIQKILSLYNVQPELLVYDLHPLYHSTRWAQTFKVERKVGVQHHHAHLLSVMAEHQLTEVIGLAFDGTGYGSDGTIWGGEFLYATRSGFKRLGCFKPFPLPGGESAVLRPIRIAAALLAKKITKTDMKKLFCERFSLNELEFQTIQDMLKKNLNCPLTSSLGRIFDAAAALLGLVKDIKYEAEGPIRLEGIAISEYFGESLSTNGTKLDELLPVLQPDVRPSDQADELFFLDPRPLLLNLAFGKNIDSVGHQALLFHHAVARGALKGARLLKKITGLNRLVLSGGVFQNILLQDLLIPALKQDGFQVFTNSAIPPGDGGIAVGQVYFKAENE